MPPPPSPLGPWIPDPGCGREGGTREVLVQGTFRLRRALRGLAAQPALSLAGFLLASGLVWWQVKEDGGGRSDKSTGNNEKNSVQDLKYAVSNLQCK